MTETKKTIKIKMAYYLKYLLLPLVLIYGALILMSLKDGMTLTLRFISGTSPILVVIAYSFGVANSVRQYREDFAVSIQSGVTRSNYAKAMIISDVLIALITSALVIIMNIVANSINVAVVKAIYTSKNYLMMYISLVIPMLSWFALMNGIGVILYKLGKNYRKLGMILVLVLLLGIFIFTDISSMDGLDADNLPSMIFISFIINVFNPSLLVMGICVILSIGMYYFTNKRIMDLDIDR